MPRLSTKNIPLKVGWTSALALIRVVREDPVEIAMQRGLLPVISFLEVLPRVNHGGAKLSTS